jgi:hypothetical protein
MIDSSFASRHAPSLVAVLGAALLLAAVPTATQAQMVSWQKRAEIVVALDDASPVRAFLDTLTTVAATAPIDSLRRAPGGTAYASLAALERALAEDGFVLDKATHAFLSYRFESNGERLVERIGRLTFVYRRHALAPSVPLVTFSADAPVVRDLLMTGGTRRLKDGTAVTLFRDALTFPRLAARPNAQLHRIDDTHVRYNFDAEKAAFLDTLTNLVYADNQTFVIR